MTLVFQNRKMTSTIITSHAILFPTKTTEGGFDQEYAILFDDWDVAHEDYTKHEEFLRKDVFKY
jgi:hypothetical protein